MGRRRKREWERGKSKICFDISLNLILDKSQLFLRTLKPKMDSPEKVLLEFAGSRIDETAAMDSGFMSDEQASVAGKAAAANNSHLPMVAI